MSDPKKALQEWQKKYGTEGGSTATSRVTGSAAGAKSALEQWQSKYTTPQTFKNQNVAFENSGLSRDEFDSSVRQNYAARAAASTPTLKTSGGYYSQPQNIGADMERYEVGFQTAERNLQDIKTTHDDYAAGLQRKQAELTSAGEKLEQMHSVVDPNNALSVAIFENERNRYNQMLDEFDAAVTEYDGIYAQYQSAYDAYSRAAMAYENYYTEQQGIYDSWKGTIRDTDTIQTEIGGVDTQIEALEQQKAALNNEATQLMNKVSSRRGGTQQLMEWSRQASEKREQANALQGEIDQMNAMKALLQEELGWSEYFDWEDYRDAEDFDSRSGYVSTANGKTRSALDIMLDNYDSSLSGFDDPLYEYINGNEEMGAYLTNQAGATWGAGGNALGALFGMATQNKSESQQMTEDEVLLFNYLYATQGKEKAHEYYEYLTSDQSVNGGSLNYRQRKEEEAEWRKYAEESPVKSSVFSVVASPMKMLTYAGQLGDILGGGEIDQNAAYNRFSYANTAIRDEVSSAIAESGKWGDVGSFTYDIGMSLADFVYQSAITGALGGEKLLGAAGAKWASNATLAIMGTGAAADMVISAKDRGLDDGQAFALGTLAGIAEIAMEKLSLDTLLKSNWEKNAIKYILKNAVVEGGEEMGTEVINTIADILIAQDQSLWQAAIDAYMEKGKSESEAFGLALADKAREIGLAGLGGFLSGGAIGTVYAPAAQIRADTYNRAGNLVRGMGDETIAELINNGLQLDEKSDGYKLAVELQEKMRTQQDIDSYDIGRLLTETAKENRKDAPATEQQKAQEANAENATTTPEEGIVLPEAGQETTQQTEQETAGELLEAALPAVEENTAETIDEPLEATLPTVETELEQKRIKAMEAASTELERTAIQYGVERTTYERVERISNLIGRNVVFYEAQDAGENGYFDRESGTIYVNARSQNPVAQILSHELTHSIEGSDAYNGLRSLVLRRMQDTGADLRKLRQAKAEQYARRGKNLTPEGVDQELVAEYVEKYLLTDEQSIRQLVKENRTLGTRIMNWVDSMLAKLGNKDAQERQFLLNARKYYAQALSQSSFTQETAKTPAPQNTDEVMARTMDMMQFSFGGRNANAADLDALRRAQEMEKQGVAAETIFRETGWYTGADGKWRFEIDDSGMEYNPRREEDGAVPGQTLADFLKHDELFQSYPQLRKTRLEFADLGRGINGQYNTETDTITLSNELRDAPEGTLIHEIQHAIQKAEGFASGANTKFWERQLESGYDGRTQQQRREVQRLWQEYNSIRDNEPDFFAAMVGLEAMAPDVPRGEINWDTLEKIEEDPIEWQRYDAAREKLEQQYGDLKVWDFTDLRYKLKQAEMNAGRSAADLYYDTAGEIEARDTARRRTMTAEERRTTMPNTGNEDTVFTETAEDEGGYFAISADEQAGIREQLRENQDRLNAMDIVGSVNTQEYAGLDTRTAREKLVSEMKKTGYKVDRQGFGEIRFEESEINNSLNYKEKSPAAEDARRTGFLVLKNVLKRGIEIDGHDKHKGRNYDTVTFAAPVEINGKRGNMAVVVKRTKGNRYKVHRILTPEGETFVMPEMANAEMNTVGAVTNDSQSLGGSAPAITTASTESVAENGLPVKEQFSFSEPVEQTDKLLALHNMDEEKLRRTLELGAWPAPSTAIVLASQGHTSYGEFSAVFPRSVIDPELDERNKVYGSDAWTPTHSNATVEREVNQREKRVFEKTIEDLSNAVAGGAFTGGGALGRAGVNDSTSKSVRDIAEQISRYPDVMAAYLALQDGDVEVKYKDKDYHRFGSNALRRYIASMSTQELAALDVAVETRDNEAIERETPRVRQVLEEVFREEIAQRRGKNGEPIPEKLAEVMLKRRMDSVQGYQIESFIQSAWQMLEDGSDTTDIDKHAMVEELESKVDKRAVAAWAEEMLAGVLGESGIYNGEDIYTENGRKSFQETHMPLTAENIVKAMYSTGQSRGEGAYGMAAGGLQSVASPSYQTVEEIRADSHRLGRVPEEELKARKDEIDEILGSLYEELNELPGANIYNIPEAVMNAAGERYVDDVIRSFEQDGIRGMSGDTALRLIEVFEMAAQLPTEYFEAKPERVVNFEDAAAVLAPDNAPIELLAQMRAAGMNVVEYEAGNDTQRLELINSLNAQFSIGGRTGAQKQEVLANLRRYMNGEMSTRDIRNYIDGLDDAGYNQPINLQTYEQSEAQEIVDAAHGQNMSVQEYLNYNWEQFERDGQMNDAAREALQLERQQSRRQYSFSGVDDGAEPGYDNILNKDARVAWGETGETFTEGNEGIAFTYAIIPADMLTTSNDSVGSVNPAYPAELQPRDRTRQSSQMQIQNIARNLNPAKLADSATAQNGAPIVRGDGVVIGGNGRGQAILHAYENGTADGYREYLEKNAQRFGIERETLPDNPVLVRVAESAENWTELARKLNESSTQTYSATERAMTDAERMGDILDMLQFDEDNRGLNTAENKDFIGAFISRVAAESERNSLLTGTGMLSQTGLERVQNAVFAKAYGSAELSARLSESLDNDMKNVTNALMATAARAVQLREGIQNGSLFELDVVEDITQAVELYAKVKAQGGTIAEWQQQMQLFDNYSPEAQKIAKFLEKNKGSSKKMRDMFNAVYAEIEELGDPRQGTLFGGGNENVTKDDIIERAAKRYAESTGRESGITGTTELGGGNLYEPEPAAGDAGRDAEDGSPGQEHPEDVGAVPRDGAVHPGAGRRTAGAQPVTAADDVHDAEVERLRNITTDDFLEELTRETQPETEKTSREDVERLRQRDLDDYWESVRQMADVLEPKTDPEEKVSTKAARKQSTTGQKMRDALSYIKRKMVDSGEAVARIGKAVGDKSLYHFYNMARASSNAATSMIMDGRTDIYGRPTGKSLNEVLGEVRSKGDEYYKKFQLYLFHMHNIDRMNRFSQENVDAAQAALEYFRMTNPELTKFADYQLERMAYDETSPYYFEASEYIELRDALRKAENTRNKPVFGFDVTAEDSKAVTDTLLRENPDFKKQAAEVYAYIDNLLRYRVDSGLITEDDYRLLKSMYPHYVPTFRVFDREGTDTRQRNKVQVGSTIKTATGSSEKLMPLHKALAQQTMSVVREGSKNRFGQRLLNSKADRKAMEHVHKVTEYQSDFSESTFDQPEDEVFKKRNTFVVREDGKLWEMEVSPALYEAVQALSPETPEDNVAIRVIRKGNNLFKALVTGYNPTFMVRNFLRDIQDAGLYSKDLSEFAMQYPQAWREIVTNGKYWQQYKALGGTYSTMFDYETGEVDKGSKLKEKTIGRVEAVNMAVEQAPRLAEFMATVKAAEKAHGTATMEDLMEGMYNAADVTVNFGRSGTLGKVLNANFVPFLNPGIQGFSKMIRNVTETKGAKNWARLAVKAAALGIAPTLLNALLWGDEDDWDDLKDRDKDVYYLFKIGDSLWLKLPKGRTLSLLGMTADRAIDLAKGEKVDWAGFIETALSQSAPANPMENNIMQAWFDTKLFDPDNPGETWYGTDIESQRLQGYRPGERYDEDTDIISKWLGKTFNLSPAKINYLLDQYTGVVGDALLPLLTPTAERDMFSAAFTLDTTYSNRFSNDFYRMKDELEYQMNGWDATGADNAIYRFWNKKSSEVSDINKIIREIEEDDTLSDADKKELTAVQYAIRNGIMEDALKTYEAYAAAAQKYYEQAVGEDKDERIDYAYREANREVLGAEYALKVYNKDVYETAQQLQREDGISYDTFYDFYFDMKAIDGKGYEKSNDKRELIREQSLTDDQKIALYTEYVSDSRADDIEAFQNAGIDFDTYLQAQNAYAEIEDSDGKATQKRTEFARWVYEQDLTPGQESVVKDSFTFFSHIPADGGRYEDFVELGVDEGTAYDIATEIGMLEPMDGKETVSSTQKWRVVVDSGLTPVEQLTALKAVTSENEYRKFSVAYDMGVLPEAFVSAKETLPRYDEDGNGSYKNAEIEAALDSIGNTAGIMLPTVGGSATLTNAQRAVLWQLLTGSTSAKNNPYSTSIGWDAIEAMNEAKESGGGISLTGGGISLTGGIVLPEA